MRFWAQSRRQENLTVSTPRHKLVIVMCKVDWNIGHRRCPEKMSSLGRPTLKKHTIIRRLRFAWTGTATLTVISVVGRYIVCGSRYVVNGSRNVADWCRCYRFGRTCTSISTLNLRPSAFYHNLVGHKLNLKIRLEMVLLYVAAS